MSELLNPFLSSDEERCLICGKPLDNDSSLITQSGGSGLQKQAKEWSTISLSDRHEFYEFTQVLKRIGDKETAFGKRHRKNKCRANFHKRSLLDSFQSMQTRSLVPFELSDPFSTDSFV